MNCWTLQIRLQRLHSGLFLAFAAVAAWDDGAAVGRRPRGCVGGSARWSGIGYRRRGGTRHARSWVDGIGGWNRSESGRRDTVARGWNTVARWQNHRRVDTGSRLSEVAHPPVIAFPLFYPLHALASWKSHDSDRSETEPNRAHDGPRYELRAG